MSRNKLFKRLVIIAFMSICSVWRAAAADLVFDHHLSGHTGWVRSVTFSPDGKLIATGGSDNTIKLWDARTGKTLRTIAVRDLAVDDMRFSPDGSLIASRSFTGYVVKLWTVANGELRASLKHERPVATFAFSPTGALIGTGGWDDQVRLWSVATGQLRHTLKGHKHNITQVVFSPDGHLIASASYEEHGNNLKLWEVATGQLRHNFAGHDYRVSAIAYAPDGKFIASGSEDGDVKLWDSETGKLKHKLEGFKVTPFHAFKRQFHMRTKDTPRFVWRRELIRELETNAEFRKAMQKGLATDVEHGVYVLEYSSDGSLLAVGSQDKTVRVWDARLGLLKFTLSGHKAPVNRLSFSPDGRFIASANSNETLVEKDPTIKIWDSASGELLHTLQARQFAVRSLAFSPLGRQLAAGGCVEMVDFRCDQGAIFVWPVGSR